MEQIIAKIYKAKLKKDSTDPEITLYLEWDNIWGEDECFSLDVPIRIFAMIFDVDKEDRDKAFEDPFDPKLEFKESKNIIDNWDKSGYKDKKMLTFK